MPDRCSTCGIELAPSLVACPSCHALVHRARLTQLAADAEAAAHANEPARAAELWREALALLPRDSAQHAAIAQRVEEQLAAQSRHEASQRTWGAAGIGALLVGILTKGKLLLLGLTKLPTLLSMLAFAGVYWSVWGWKFAVAVVAAIYIHEMGHVAALMARGLPASAPMFVPGLGAFVRLHGQPVSPREDSRIGLAGPIWGLGAALAAIALAFALHAPFWRAVAHTTAVINLFNLTPVWDLDGARGLRALSKKQRWLVLALLAATFAATREGMLVIVALGMAWAAYREKAPQPDDWGAFGSFATLVIALSAITKVPVAIL
jgi:Zn-dependent protease